MKKNLTILLCIVCCLAGGYLIIAWRTVDEKDLSYRIAVSENFKKQNFFLNAQGKESRMLHYSGRNKRKMVTQPDLDRVMNNYKLSSKEKADSLSRMVPITPSMQANFDSARIYGGKLSEEFPELKNLSIAERNAVILAAYKIYDKKRNASYATYFDN
ncbi:MAG: hypothetical protein JWQ09_4194 [Segetibacter sp.]|nr:hypothetical protein [Segetibacter sp.]